jgi:hypothetical protein
MQCSICLRHLPQALHRLENDDGPLVNLPSDFRFELIRKRAEKKRIRGGLKTRINIKKNFGKKKIIKKLTRASGSVKPRQQIWFLRPSALRGTKTPMGL